MAARILGVPVVPALLGAVGLAALFWPAPRKPPTNGQRPQDPQVLISRLQEMIRTASTNPQAVRSADVRALADDLDRAGLPQQADQARELARRIAMTEGTGGGGGDPADPGSPMEALRRDGEMLLARSREEGTVTEAELRNFARALDLFPELRELADRLRVEADAIAFGDGQQTPPLPVPVWCVGDLPRGVGVLPAQILDRISAVLNSNAATSAQAEDLASELEACSPSGGWSGHVGQIRNRANLLRNMGR